MPEMTSTRKAVTKKKAAENKKMPIRRCDNCRRAVARNPLFSYGGHVVCGPCLDVLVDIAEGDL